MFPAGIRAAPFPAYAWLPPARLLLEPVNGSRTLYVDTRILISAKSSHFLLKRPCGAVQFTGVRDKPPKGRGPQGVRFWPP